jgi:hypothetical protein
MAGIGFGTNYDVKAGNGLGPRTRIVSVNKGTGDHTQAELDALVAAMTSGTTLANTADAVTIAGVAGTVGTDPLYLAVQGTGTIATTAGDYVADITVAVVADFTD